MRHSLRPAAAIIFAFVMPATATPVPAAQDWIERSNEDAALVLDVPRYAEAIAYLPLDAQLIGLQYRLMRAARMFLDPSFPPGAPARRGGGADRGSQAVIISSLATSGF
jgi:hypothetical protein